LRNVDKRNNSNLYGGRGDSDEDRRFYLARKKQLRLAMAAVTSKAMQGRGYSS
jgi:hypothetical protein